MNKKAQTESGDEDSPNWLIIILIALTLAVILFYALYRAKQILQ